MDYIGECSDQDKEILRALYRVHQDKLRERFGEYPVSNDIIYTSLFPELFATTDGKNDVHNNDLISLVTHDLPSQQVVQTSLAETSDQKSSLTDALAFKSKLKAFLQSLLQRVYEAQFQKVLGFGFIQAPHGNKTQAWHTDYGGKTENIFIPLVPMTDLNGTEYVHFEDPDAAKFWFWYIYAAHDFSVELPATLFPDGDSRHNIPNAPSKKYTVKRWNAQPFSISRMPYYLYHRGPTNLEKEMKVLFYITVTSDPTFDVEEHLKGGVVVTGKEDVGTDQIPGTDLYERKKQHFDQKVLEVSS